MSQEQSPAVPSELQTEGKTSEARRQDMIYRVVAALVIALLLWLAYRNRSDGSTLIFVIPLIIGAAITGLRLPAISEKVNLIEQWLQRGSVKAAESDSKFARFFRRPFFDVSLAVWRWTTPISDAHLRAGVRTATLMIVGCIALTLLVMAVYIIVVIAVFLLLLVGALWILSHSGSSGPSDQSRIVTRETTDWFGRPKQEHFDGSGQKIGESRPDSDWLGRPKTVNMDAAGNVVGESKADTDWLGNPKIVHTDAQGNFTGESRPDTDWFGQPKTVHTDAEGNVIAESREETDFFGRPQTVRRDT
jgi:hypothetical protein